jgi:hypothetical protein
MPIFPDSKWNQDTAIFLGTVPVSWNIEQHAIDWIDIDIQGEVTDISRQPAAVQNQWHLTWVPRESSRHRMAFDVADYFDTSAISSLIPGNNCTYSLIQIPPGRILPWHRDYYNTHIKKFNITEQHAYQVHRAVLCLNSWTYGQIVQIGSEMLHHWRAGDLFSWPHAAWHGAANFGNHAMTFLQITYDNISLTASS